MSMELKIIYLGFSLFFLISFVYAGSYIEFEKREIVFHTPQELSQGISITAINSGCCPGDIRLLDFSITNPSYEIQGISLPHSLDAAGGSVTFKILARSTGLIPTNTDEMLKLYAVYNQDFLIIKYDPQTMVSQTSGEPAHPFSLTLIPGKLLLKGNDTFMVSASLFSTQGKEISSLFNDQKVNRTGQFQFSTQATFDNISSGTYILYCKFLKNHEYTLITKTIIIPQSH